MSTIPITTLKALVLTRGVKSTTTAVRCCNKLVILSFSVAECDQRSLSEKVSTFHPFIRLHLLKNFAQ